MQIQCTLLTVYRAILQAKHYATHKIGSCKLAGRGVESPITGLKHMAGCSNFRVTPQKVPHENAVDTVLLS